MIKAPFNFVSLPQKEYCPKWASYISHDVPFEDSISGTISLKFRAETPVFIRNGHKKEDAPTENNRRGERDFATFSKVENDKFFIPGSSVKGMIRSVMEIMTFGRLHVNKEAMFAQREWGNFPLFPFVAPKEASTEVSKETLQIRNSIQCGWLKECFDGNESRYIVSKCPTYYRINHKRIDEFLKKRLFEEEFGKHYVKEKLPDENKTSTYKYHLLNNDELESLKNVPFKKDDVYACKYQENRVMVCNKNDSDCKGEGTIVFTGQPDTTSWKEPRGMGDGKFYEFVFPNEEEYAIEISQELFDNYNFIFSALSDWDELKRKMRDGGIPVFFRERIVDGKPAIKDLGLAFLYKLPYENTPYELEEKYRTYISDKNSSQKVGPDSPDMAACIFGYINPKTKHSIKGRVQVSPFFCTNKVECKEYRLTLNSPKASYYPIYIQQNNVDASGHVKGAYNTYNDGVLSGWKRYNLRDNIWESCSPDENNKIDTYIQPLGVGSTFEGEIHFHNLKKVELGALLSALTFFGANDCQHQIGQAKPYGFGRISWSNLRLDIAYEENEKNNTDYYMALFEQHMNKVLDRDWYTSDQIIKLLSMSHTVVKDGEDSHYMTLSMKDSNTGQEARNDFQTAKDEKEYLRDFNALYRNPFIPDSKISLIEENEIGRLHSDVISCMRDAEVYMKAEEYAKAEETYKHVQEIIDKLCNNYNIESSKKELDDYREEIKDKLDTIRIKSEIGDTPFEEHIADAKYVLPLANRVLEWCKVSGVLILQAEQIKTLEAKVRELYDKTPEKKKKTVLKEIQKALDKIQEHISSEDYKMLEDSFTTPN